MVVNICSVPRKESETVEFKKSTSELKEAVISLVAMLNKHKRGELYFGIKNDGSVVGQSVSENTLREISRAIADNIEPKIFPKITGVVLDGKKCVLVDFSGENIPYYAYGRAYMRIGDEDRKLSVKELERMILSKNKEKLRWDNQICKHATIKDLDDETFKNFLALAKKEKRIAIKEESKELLLKKLGLITKEGITNAAILLFGKEPFKFFVNTAVKAGRFKDFIKKEFIDIKDFNGNLFQNFENGMLFFQNHLRTSAKIEGVMRKEKWEIPLEALREALINALIHRDYFVNGFVYIKIYNSSIVISNPGQLPETLSIADLYKEHDSDLRNPLIAYIFYYAGFIDKWGRGILTMLEYLKKEQLEIPAFSQTGNYFGITFKRPLLDETEEDLPKVIKKKTVEKTVEKILTIIQKNPKITQQELSKNTGLTRRGVEWNLKQLKEKNIIKRIGPDKGGYWRIIQQRIKKSK